MMRLPATVAIGSLVLIGACERLTAVEYPDVVQPDQLENASGAAALLTGARHLFAAAFNGSVGTGSAFVYTTALMSDELRGAVAGGIILATDLRDLTPTTTGVGEVFAALSRSRVTALAAVQSLEKSAPTPGSRIAEAFAIAGFSELFIAQMYCSGAPLTDVVSGQPTTYGTSLTKEQLYQRAAESFDSALAHAGTDAASRNLGALGKARALVELDQYDAAAAAVGEVPTTFSYAASYNATLLPNVVGQIAAAALTNPNARVITVGNAEGTNGLNFRSAGDPRVRVTAAGRGVDGATDVFVLTNLNDGSATMVTNGVEARLIEAEAALRRGDASWLATLNTLRASAITPAMPALTDPGTAAARVDLLFRERAFWLFATGHRLADLRRLVRQYGRAVDATFPTGSYDSARQYLNEVNAPLPIAEELRNPNFNGCLDRDA